MGRPRLRELNTGPEVNWLFVDLNAYFASVEQQERPELRGRPVAVAQVLTPNTVCIAASYQAKPYGVKTGVKLYEAQRLCPELTIVLARPKLYVAYHHRILAAIETVLPITDVLSIDEAACRLTGQERWLPNARSVARHFLSGSLPLAARSARFDPRPRPPAGAPGVSKLPRPAL